MSVHVISCLPTILTQYITMLLDKAPLANFPPLRDLSVLLCKLLLYLEQTAGFFD